jgi:beta-lactam-binding protein with PASTA domain
VAVPDFTAMSVREALVVASQRGLRIRVTGPGPVVEQDPAPGEPVEPGTEVRIENDGG